MGKAIVIGVTLVILAALLLWWLGWLRRHESRQADKAAGRPVRGDMNAAAERVLIDHTEEAARILRLLINPDLQHPSYVDPEHRADVDRWLQHHTTVMKGTRTK